MSNNIFPIPVNTPFFDITNSKVLSMPWNLYLKNIGDDLLMANILKNSIESTAFKYVLNANICFCIYNVDIALTSPLVITLPYPSTTAFKVNNTKYLAGTKSITIPIDETFAQFWYTV